MLPGNATLQQTRYALERNLRKIYSEGEAKAVTRLILEHFGYPTALILREPSRQPGAEILTQIKEIVVEIHTGRPIQYVLGYTYFSDLKIEINKNVLIPRPETEEMVHRILQAHATPPAAIVDLGTGSGCIALALKQHYRGALVFGVDHQPGAIGVAKRNARNNQLEVNWIVGDINKRLKLPFSGKIDLIVGNPPYIRESERSLIHTNVKEYEPPEALFVPDSDPLVFYRSIARIGQEMLSPGGTVWVEINEKLGKETASLFSTQGYHTVKIIRDIHEKERFISAIRPQQ